MNGKTIFASQKHDTTPELTLVAENDGVVLSYVSVFDSDSEDVDTYASRPFSLVSMAKAIDHLVLHGQCELCENEQFVEIKKEPSGTFTFFFQFSGHSDIFQIQGLLFDPESVLRKLRDCQGD